MKCEKCHEHEATVFITQYINGEAIEMHLCETCAAATPKNLAEEGLSFQQFLSGLLETGKPVQKQSNAPSCPNCGMTLVDFKKHSKVGCAQCYKTFGQHLKPVIKRLHGSLHHTGKQPSRLSEALQSKKEIENMQATLNKALIEENYEEAARLRDLIRDRKKEVDL